MTAQKDNPLPMLIELSLIPELGTIQQSRLWSACPDVAEIFAMSRFELRALGLKSDVSAAISDRRYAKMADEILDWGRKENCHFVARNSESYPSLLEQIFDPPLLLYCRGRLAALTRPSVAVVGTRKPTCYGLQMAEGLAFDLAQRDIVIVSGMARGIDGAAHRGCLDAGTDTVAVLGSGIDVVYPKEHRTLSRKIEECGVLVSEFPPGTPPRPQNFPLRNRIISGLTLGCLIIEARERSGSLITARLAAEQNRDILAVPANITTPQGYGPNYLIKQGAKLVQSWRDVVEELPPDLRQKVMSGVDGTKDPPPDPGLDSETQGRVLELLPADEAWQFDKILLTSGLAVSKLSEILLGLEIRGLVRQLPGNLYIRVARRLSRK